MMRFDTIHSWPLLKLIVRCGLVKGDMTRQYYFAQPLHVDICQELRIYFLNSNYIRNVTITPCKASIRLGFLAPVTLLSFALI